MLLLETLQEHRTELYFPQLHLLLHAVELHPGQDMYSLDEDESFITEKGLDIRASSPTVAPLVKCQRSGSTTALLHPTRPSTPTQPVPSSPLSTKSSNIPRAWPHYNLYPYQPYQPSLRRMSLKQSNKSLNQSNKSLNQSKMSLIMDAIN